MPIGNFSVGRDLTFTLVTPSGNLTLNGLTDYETKAMFTDLKHKGLDGNVLHAAVPDGWQLTIRVDRQDPTLDNFFATLEANYFAGQNIQSSTITETITENNGSISQFQYTNVSLKYDGGGSWKGDSLIAITLTGSASRRNKIS